MSSADPPPLAELQEIAERAVRLLDGEDGQVALVWERVRGSAERETLTATFTVVADGRAAVATAAGLGEAVLARAAKSATVNARRPRAWPAAALPDPAPAPEPHEGWDPGVLAWRPEPAPGLAWEAAAARIAIASTRGVRATDQRTHARLLLRRRAGGRTEIAGAAATGPAGLAAAALERDLARRSPPPGAGLEPAGAGILVLGPPAVATALDRLRPAFGVHLDVGGGPLAGRLGQAIAAPGVHLTEAPAGAGTLPRSFDAEGVPRTRVDLVRDGVLTGRVHDSTSAARQPGASSTGHATRAGALAPVPEHLALAGPAAAPLEELWEAAGDGLHIPWIEPGPGGALRALGAVRLAGGRPTAPVADHGVDADPLALLACVVAAGDRAELVVLRGGTPGGAAAATVPALLCAQRAGVARA